MQQLQDTLRLFAGLGMEVAITELDVCPTVRPGSTAELRNVSRSGSDNYYRVVAIHSGHCLQYVGRCWTNGGLIIQSRCTQEDHQLWRLDQAPGHL